MANIIAPSSGSHTSADSNAYNKIVAKRQSRYEQRKQSVNNWVKNKVGEGASIGLFIGRILGVVMGIVAVVALSFIGVTDNDFSAFYVGSSIGELIGAGLGIATGIAFGWLYASSKKTSKSIDLETKDIAREKQEILAVTNKKQPKATPLIVPPNANLGKYTAALRQEKSTRQQNQGLLVAL